MPDLAHERDAQSDSVFTSEKDMPTTTQGNLTEATGLTESEDFENYEEETEELFLASVATSKGGKNAPAMINQISKMNYAMG